MKPTHMIAAGIAFFIGACAVFVFLTLNDPQTVSPETTSRFGWFLLAPAAFLLCFWAGSMFWLSMLSMIAGIFVGVCVRSLIPPASNIWPIAAAIWTGICLLPIISGASAGGIGYWIMRKVRK